MIVDVHTHVWECPCHIGEQFIADARTVAGDAYQDISVDLDRHWEAMQAVDRAVVLGFRARHVGVLVPNEYVAEYAGRHPEKLSVSARSIRRMPMPSSNSTTPSRRSSCAA